MENQIIKYFYNSRIFKLYKFGGKKRKMILVGVLLQPTEIIFLNF